MFRAIPTIVAAILSLHPGVGRKRAVSYAKVMQSEAVKRHFDPFTYITLASHESKLNERAEGDCKKDGTACRAIGLGQIWAMHVGACRSDPEPNGNPGKACLQVRQSLRNGEYNIRVMARALSIHRKRCQKETGQALLWQTLGSYGGIGCSRKAKKHKGVRWIVNRRKQLLRRLSRDRKRARASATR